MRPVVRKKRQCRYRKDESSPMTSVRVCSGGLAKRERKRKVVNCASRME